MADMTKDDGQTVGREYPDVSGGGVPYPPRELNVRGYEDLIKTARDDGHTVALPLTQEQAREALVQIMAEALDQCGEIDLNADELEEAANYAADAAWSAPPEVLAAAMGGTYLAVNRLIVLPREVDGEGGDD